MSPGLCYLICRREAHQPAENEYQESLVSGPLIIQVGGGYAYGLQLVSTCQGAGPPEPRSLPITQAAGALRVELVPVPVARARSRRVDASIASEYEGRPEEDPKSRLAAMISMRRIASVTVSVSRSDSGECLARPSERSGPTSQNSSTRCQTSIGSSPSRARGRAVSVDSDRGTAAVALRCRCGAVTC